jgi:hypothetical protein
MSRLNPGGKGAEETGPHAGKSLSDPCCSAAHHVGCSDESDSGELGNGAREYEGGVCGHLGRGLGRPCHFPVALSPP